MKYYQVKAEADQSRINAKGFEFLIAKELYTEKQIIKMNLTDKFISDNFNIVYTSKFNTYYFFGARFSPQTNILN